jgi:hypothetical protein
MFLASVVENSNTSGREATGLLVEELGGQAGLREWDAEGGKAAS